MYIAVYIAKINAANCKCAMLFVFNFLVVFLLTQNVIATISIVTIVKDIYMIGTQVFLLLECLQFFTVGIRINITLIFCHQAIPQKSFHVTMKS
jgi:hypothetical protein